MRNLKRTLSLALAAVMLMGMMVVGAGAASSDFTDADEIKNVEAVDVMVALGILEGGDKGDFQPNSILTREQAAKIICYMLLGEEAAEKLATSGAVFTDVAADRWSAPFIGYCVNLGILAGDGQGHFFPEGKLTGAAFAKMLLVALGYDPKIENYTGNSWTINVAADAIEAGISPKGLVLTNELSRQDAAQMAFQALTANMVKYDNKGIDIDFGNGGGSVNMGASNAEPVANDKSDDYRVVSADRDEYQQFCEKYFSDLKLDTGDVRDDFGAPATKWTYDGDTVGTYATKAAVKTYVEGFDADELKDLKDDDYDFSKATVYVNGSKDASLNADKLAAREYVGTVIEMYANGDKAKEITHIVVKQGYLAQVTDLDDESVSLDIYNPWDKSTATNVTFDDDTKKNNDTFDKLSAKYEEDDYLIVYTKGAVVDAAVLAIADVETVSGKVATTKITAADGYNGYFTIDGTKYTLASGYTEATVIKAGSEYDFYLDENGFVIGAETVKEASATIDEVYYVDKVWDEVSKVSGANVTTYYAQLVALDGTISQIELENVDKATGTGTYLTNFDGKLVTISDKKWTDNAKETHKSGDDKFDLTVWAPNTEETWDLYDNVTFNAKLEKTSTRISTSAKTFRLNADTKYVFVEGTTNKLDTSVYTGGVAYDTSKATKSFVITEDGSAVAKYIIIVTNNADQAQTFSDDAIFIAKASTEMGDGYRVQTVYYADGKKDTMNVAEGQYPLTAGFYTYDTDEDGYYVLDDANKMTVTTGFVWDDEEGVIANATIGKDALFENLLTVTVDGKKVEDIEVAEAAFVDTHDTDAGYSKTVSSLESLTNLVNDEKVGAVTLSLNVSKDGAVIIVVTDIAAK
ncbi:S-layer homology domain-containing protein [Flavonifractor sp. An112]|uniref:S-layer homology domain-containing protein n=1 Tax=Flavonifractor sp. An112 TaxID=1965544 RepID=UPI00174C9445|nr:S-layer homology domain-containing protein [Flavonifractor sp. An112]HIZ94636.1 S-layer homology domain-containing protein [Candidatus Flavonifractor avicola]